MAIAPFFLSMDGRWTKSLNDSLTVQPNQPTNQPTKPHKAREAICAAHLLLSLLHNCAGRIDAAVGPTLGLVLGRLDPKPTQKELPVRIVRVSVA